MLELKKKPTSLVDKMDSHLEHLLSCFVPEEHWKDVTYWIQSIAGHARRLSSDDWQALGLKWYENSK